MPSSASVSSQTAEEAAQPSGKRPCARQRLSDSQTRAEGAVARGDEQGVDRHFNVAGQDVAADGDRADNDPDQGGAAKDPETASAQDVLDHPQDQRQPDRRRHDHREDGARDQKAAKLVDETRQPRARALAAERAQVARHEETRQPEVEQDEPAEGGAERHKVVGYDAERVERRMLARGEKGNAAEKMGIPERDFTPRDLRADEGFPLIILQDHVREQVVLGRRGVHDLAIGGVRQILKQVLGWEERAAAERLLMKHQQRREQQKQDKR